VRNTLVMIVLAILAAATWIATWSPQDQAVPAERSANEGPLGYYIRGARWSSTDDQGRVTYRIRAERLDELPAADDLQLEGVSVEYQPAADTAWAISAANGSALRDGSLLELSGDVEIRNVPTDGSAQQTYLTQALRFWPDTSNVESDHAVEIRVGDWHFNSMGFSSDLKGRTLRLESDVHGTFAPR
jgi:LPS export ABC transporter protein LptC